MKEGSEKKETAADEEDEMTVYYDVTAKNPMFYFQEAIRVFLKCLGFESESLSSSSSSSSSKSSDEKESDIVEQKNCEDGEGKQEYSDSTYENNNNNKDDPPADDDPPQSHTPIEEAAAAAAGRRGRAAPRPGVSRGSPPQNN